MSTHKYGYVCGMKTTIELPDDLLRTLKAKAANEGRSLKDVLVDMLRAALRSSKPKPKAATKPYDWPIIESRRAEPGEEITPDRLYEILYGPGE